MSLFIYGMFNVIKELEKKVFKLKAKTRDQRNLWVDSINQIQEDVLMQDMRIRIETRIFAKVQNSLGLFSIIISRSLELLCLRI